MSSKCPSCQRVLYNRRLEACGFCGAPIPEELRFTPEEMAELDRKMAQSEEQRRHREQVRVQEDEKQAERQRAAKNGSSSKSGGLPAVFVFGVGLLIVGFSLPAERHAQAVSLRWGGALVLALGVLAILVQTGRLSRELVVSGVATLCTAALVFSAARSELTGRAVYHHHFLMRHGWRTEAVTRQEKPAMFREATDVRWALGIVCAAVSFGSFVFYRKAEYEEG